MSNFNYDIKANDYEGDGPAVFVPNNPLNRPEIKFTPVVLALSGFAALVLLSFFISFKYIFGGSEGRVLYSVCACIGTALLYCMIIAKRAIVWAVKAYQHYAPERVRLKCVFEPSCSEYMLLAIDKYGLFVGVYKGIKRLFRCHPPGGIDYP